MNKIDAIFLDLDGTALLPDHSISPILVETLDKARHQGIEVVVCTGRNYSASLSSVQALKIKNYVINYNGGRIFDLNAQKVLSETQLTPTLVEGLIQFATHNSLHLNLYHDDFLYVEAATEEAEFYKKTTNTDYHVIDFKNFIGKPSTKALIVAPPDHAPTIIQKLQGEFFDITIVPSTDTLIEILPKGMSKARGVEFITNKLGIDPANTMAFGDQWNDFEMLNYVGHGYLMGNAPDSLKKEIPLERHTLSNIDNGIVHILNQFI